MSKNAALVTVRLNPQPKAATGNKRPGVANTKHDASNSDNSQLTAECLETSVSPPQSPYWHLPYLGA
jgi:hypothetical protein